MSEPVIINKTSALKGAIAIPGDKSISHRALIIGALAEGPVEIEGFLNGRDPLATLKCLRDLGVKIKDYGRDGIRNIEYGTRKIMVMGTGGKLTKPDKPLYAGNSGTTIRILSGILASQNFDCEISGDESIRTRPMKRIAEPLGLMGAKIDGRRDGDKLFPPLKIFGSKLKGINYKLPVASAQVKSSILLAGLLAEGETIIEERVPSRDHTERMLKAFKVKIKRRNHQIIVIGGQKLKGNVKISVPGDISSAAFFMVAAALVPGSNLIIKKVGLNPTRIGVLEILHRMGIEVEIIGEKIISEEPRAEVKVKSPKSTSRELKAIIIEGEVIPRLIDEIPIIAVLATQVKGKTVIKDAKELRVKESDRIATVCAELKKLGADITPTNDGMIINGPTKLQGAEVDSHGDHRLAMSLAVAGLLASGPTKIHDVDCVETSFPGFFEVLKNAKR